MRPWTILLIIVFALWLISLIRAGASVRYDGDGLKVRLGIGPVSFTVFPVKKKKKPKPEKRNRKGPRPSRKHPPKKVETWSGQAVSSAAAEAPGASGKDPIDDVEMELTWGADDPDDAALGYGFANAALGMLWPLIENNFNVRHKRLGTSVDYNAAGP
jgi:hypothetical protein